MLGTVDPAFDYPSEVGAVPGAGCFPVVEVRGLSVSKSGTDLEFCWNTAEGSCLSGYELLGSNDATSDSGWGSVGDPGAATSQVRLLRESWDCGEPRRRKTLTGLRLLWDQSNAVAGIPPTEVRVGVQDNVEDAITWSQSYQVDPGDVRLDLPSAAVVELTIYDARGAVVQRISAGQLAAGTQTLSWDGRDTTGKSAASGVYFARVRLGRETLTERFVLVR